MRWFWVKVLHALFTVETLTLAISEHPEVMRVEITYAHEVDEMAKRLSRNGLL